MGHAIDLAGFVTLGLLGGFGHCVGMCSPFVMLVSQHYAHASRRHSAVSAQAWYTAGRIVTYAALGAAAGALGGVTELAGNIFGFQRTAGLIAGAALVIWGVSALSSLVPRARRGSAVPSSGPPGNPILSILRRRVPSHTLVAGLLLGFLPCGLLYSALIAGVALGGPLRGATALVLFGLGTAPAMLGVSVAHTLLARRAFLDRLSHVFLLAMGVWFVWHGLA